MSTLKPLLFAVLLALAGPAFAGEPMPSAGLLRVGNTGINCITAPCPWRGIVVLDLSGDPVGAPLWSGDELPPLLGTPADRQRLHASWSAFGCLVLDGQFDGTTLTVARITGPC